MIAVYNFKGYRVDRSLINVPLVENARVMNLCSSVLLLKGFELLIIVAMPGLTPSDYRVLQRNKLKNLKKTHCTLKNWKTERWF